MASGLVVFPTLEGLAVSLVVMARDVLTGVSVFWIMDEGGLATAWVGGVLETG